MASQSARNVIAFFSFLATGLNLVLAFYVLYKNPRRRVNQLFALVALSLAVWAFGDGAYNLSHSVGMWKFWVRFQAPGEILFPVLFLHLALVFTEPRAVTARARAWIVGLLYSVAAFTIVAFYSTPWVFTFRSAPAETLTIKGWLYWGYAAFSYVLLLAALGLYIYNYSVSRRLYEKRIAQVMIAAVALPLIINVLEATRLYTLSSAPCFFTITAAVFAYGILKHQMFAEVDAVLKRSLVYGALTVLFTCAYVLTIIVSERFVSDFFSVQGYAITVLFVLVLVIVFEPLRARLMRGVDKVFFRKDYEYGRVLGSLAESLAELSSLDEISRRVTDTLTGSMGLTGAALFYEPRGGDSLGYLKQTVAGFVPAYMDDPGRSAELADGKLEVEQGDGTRTAFDVLEVPLVFERERVGTLALGQKLSGYDFSFSDRSLLAAMAPQLAIALENGALFQEVLEKQRRVNELMELVANAHEEERRRISRELHDGVAQSFLGVVYLSEFTLEGLEQDLARSREDLEKLNERARDGLEELRAVINDLRPIPLEVLGLRGAAAKLVADLCAEGQLSCELESNLAEGEKLPPLIEGNLYRILQEALNNARKYSEAQTVRVGLRLEDGAVVLEVSDDGKGMPKEVRASQESGLGMSSMRQRAEEMGGQLEIRSAADEGTVVRVTVETDVRM